MQDLHLNPVLGNIAIVISANLISTMIQSIPAAAHITIEAKIAASCFK
jgi:hypothetical protein